MDGSPAYGGDGRRSDASTPPRRPKPPRRGALSSWIDKHTSIPLQALKRPYRAVLCRWRQTLHRAHAAWPHTLASQRGDAPAPMDRTARLRQETPRGSFPGISSGAAAKRRPRIRPRLKFLTDGKSEVQNPKKAAGRGDSPVDPADAQNGPTEGQKWQALHQGEGRSYLYCLSPPDRTCTCTRLFWLFCTLFAVGSHRVGNYISKQYTITRTVFLTMKKPVLHETSVGKYPAKRRYT